MLNTAAERIQTAHSNTQICFGYFSFMIMDLI